MIDAHAHLWLKQHGRVNGLPVYHIGGGLTQEKQLFLHENAKAFYGFDCLPEMPYVHHMAE